MKKVLTALIFVAIVLAGCRSGGPVASGGTSSTAVSDSASEVLIKTPRRARDAASRANEQTKQLQQDLPY